MKCPVCDSILINSQIFEFGEEYSLHINILNEKRNFLFCENCELGYFEEYFTEEKLDELYSRKYRECNIYSINKGDHFHKYHYDTRYLAQILLARQFYEFKENGNMLDIGPGMGYSFWTAKQILPKLNYFAVEPGSQPLELLKKLNVNVFNDLLLKVGNQIPDNYFDFILMSHSLEHFNSRDLNNVLSLLNEKLVSGGIIVIEVPYCEVPQQHSNDNDVFLPDPTHLTFFSPKSLEILLKNNNYEICFCNCSGIKYKYYSPLKPKNNKHNQNKISIKKILIEKSPQIIKNYLHTIQAIRSGYNINTILKDCNFDYSFDRISIRILGRKK